MLYLIENSSLQGDRIPDSDAGTFLALQLPVSAGHGGVNAMLTFSLCPRSVYKRHHLPSESRHPWPKKQRNA
jgi:hypothetical protein